MSHKESLPTNRSGVTIKLEITSEETGQLQQGYITANFVGDKLVEVFVTDFGKSGSTLEGWTQFCAILFSMGLQEGLVLDHLAEKVEGMKFEPYGKTNDPVIPECSSVPDYMMKWLRNQVKLRTPV